MTRVPLRTARLAAALLSGCWRREPPPIDLAIGEADLPGLCQLLLPSGSGALGWAALRRSALAASPEAVPLRDAFRVHALEAAVHEQSLATTLSLLHAADVRPVLLKGWSVARLYPDVAMRPYGDIDLLVRPAELERAKAALQSPALDRIDVDISGASEDLEDLDLEDVFRRAVEVESPAGPVKVLSPEHLLRHLCMHQLRHGLWRPLWLADVGLVLESLPPGFQWDVCLGGDAWTSEGVRHVIGLARELLRAAGESPPGAGPLPGWLAPAVLEQWPRFTEHYYTGTPLVDELARPTRLLDALVQRWSGPIQATVAIRAPWSGWPRFGVQLADWTVRAAGFVRRRGGPPD